MKMKWMVVLTVATALGMLGAPARVTAAGGTVTIVGAKQLMAGDQTIVANGTYAPPGGDVLIAIKVTATKTDAPGAGQLTSANATPNAPNWSGNVLVVTETYDVSCSMLTMNPLSKMQTLTLGNTITGVVVK
jgi:hypothetical protein